MRRRALVCGLAISAGLAAPLGVRTQPRTINVDRSTLTVYAYKAGLFSAFADNHIIRAPIESGSISAEPSLGVELTVKAGKMVVLDLDLPAGKRADVQARMLGPEVLDTAKYPDITFTSTSVEPAATDQWKVTGRLTIRGQTRPVTISAVRQDGHYRGSVEIRQRDFGIDPISIAGGTVKVKDQVKIEFDIVP